MFWPVTSSPRCEAHSAVRAVFSPPKVELTCTPRWRSSAAFAARWLPAVTSRARSQGPVQRDRAVRALVAAAGGPVGAGRGGLHRQQRVADRGQPALDEFAVAVGQAAQ